MKRVVVVLLLSLLLPACGEGRDTDDQAKAPVNSVRGKRPAFALEIWVPYPHRAHQQRRAWLRRVRSLELDREGAQKVAMEAHAAVVQDPKVLPLLARTESGAVGGWIGGYSGPIGDPAQGLRDDARTRAILRAEIGEVTEVLDWQEGFWFGQRISAEDAKRYERRLADARRGLKARARICNVHYAWAKPRKHEYDNTTREQARVFAKKLLTEAQDGRPLAEIAAEHARDDLLKSRSGLFYDKRTDGSVSDWIGWDSPWTPYPFLVALLEDAPVGKVMPEILDTDYGIVIIEVLERRVHPTR